MAPNQGFTLWLDRDRPGAGKTTLVESTSPPGSGKVARAGGDSGSRTTSAVWPSGAEPRITEGGAQHRRGARWASSANLLTRNQVASLVRLGQPLQGGPRRQPARSSAATSRSTSTARTEKLIERDSTGKYKKALAGEIPNFVGITEPYEPPDSPEVTIHSDIGGGGGRGTADLPGAARSWLRHRRRSSG